MPIQRCGPWQKGRQTLWMMPDDIRAQVFGSIAPVVACTDLLLAHWTGQGWQAEAAPKRTLFPADIAPGKALWARMRPPE